MKALTLRTLCVMGLVALLAGEARAQATLVWSDEFNGTQINPGTWEHMTGGTGWGNNELQYYTNRSVNSFVSGGSLHIVAREENFGGRNYTSARLRTRYRQDFLYGRIEARIKLPSTPGIWPAFWMLPTGSPYGGWAASGEIDIMESVNIATTIYGTTHFGGQWPDHASAGGVRQGGVDYSQDFHVYAIEWTPDQIRWYVDDVSYYTQDSSVWYSDNAPNNPRAPFDQLFHVLLNVAVGGDFPGSPNGSSVFPQEMLVDYVRVYDLFGSDEQAPFGGQPRSIPGQIEAEDFDEGGEGEAYHDCDVTNNGGLYRPTDGVDIQIAGEGGFNVGWMCEDEWMEYTVDVAEAGAYLIEARVASLETGGTFHLAFDGVDLTGPIAVPVTGGWLNWVTITDDADLSAGTQIMRFVNDSTSEAYNLNYLRFTALSPADLNRDGSVNALDVADLVGCMNGPAAGTAPAGCDAVRYDRSDLNDDGTVDLRDVASFDLLYTL